MPSPSSSLHSTNAPKLRSIGYIYQHHIAINTAAVSIPVLLQGEYEWWHRSSVCLLFEAYGSFCEIIFTSATSSNILYEFRRINNNAWSSSVSSVGCRTSSAHPPSMQHVVSCTKYEVLHTLLYTDWSNEIIEIPHVPPYLLFCMYVHTAAVPVQQQQVPVPYHSVATWRLLMYPTRYTWCVSTQLKYWLCTAVL